MTKKVFTWPKKSEATLNREEIEKVNKKIEKLKNNLGRIESIVLTNFNMIKSLTELMSKLLKMLCDPNYGTNYLYDKEKKAKKKIKREEVKEKK